MWANFIETSFEEAPKYPYLGKFEDGQVILFVAPLTGVCVGSPYPSQIGKACDDWNERTSTVIHGKLEMEL